MLRGRAGTPTERISQQSERSGGAGPAPIPIELNRESSDSTKMTVGQLGFFMPLVESVLNKPQRALASGAIAYIQAAVL